jgi:hypothetical protein
MESLNQLAGRANRADRRRLSGASGKGQPLFVLLRSGLFAHEIEERIWESSKAATRGALRVLR